MTSRAPDTDPGYLQSIQDLLLSLTTSVGEHLHDWQTLWGSMIGAAAAVFGVYLAAKIGTRREDIIASKVVQNDLRHYLTFLDKMRTSTTARPVGLKDEFKNRVLLARIIALKDPKLSPLFEASMARLLPYQVEVSSALSQFFLLHSEIRALIGRQPDSVLASDGPVVGSDGMSGEMEYLERIADTACALGRSAQVLIIYQVDAGAIRRFISHRHPNKELQAHLKYVRSNMNGTHDRETMQKVLNTIDH